MTPEQEQILTNIADQLRMLFASSTIPRDVETAFLERLNIVQGIQDAGTPATTTFAGLPVVVPNATKMLTITYKGVKYNLLAQ